MASWSSLQLGTLRDRKECTAEFSQLRKMGCLSPNSCQSLVQARLLPRGINSLACATYLPQAKELQWPKKARRQTGAGACGWPLDGVHGNRETSGDTGGHRQLPLQTVWTSAASSTRRDPGHAAGMQEVLTQRKSCSSSLKAGATFDFLRARPQDRDSNHACWLRNRE